MSLITEYRPEAFSEIVGNRELIVALDSVLLRESGVPHAFLFSGDTGCGKTTLGRIVRNCLGCSDNNYREIDSADFRGIDTIRDIRQSSRLAGFQGGVRVFLLDECHQLSRDAQNALLKGLEDPPKHVYYILCTTDPQKLLPTIVGRCSHFQVTPLSEREIVKLLRRVSKAYGSTIPKDVCIQIAEDSFGRPRDALQLLDKIIDLPEDKMLSVVTQEAERQSEIIELCRALIKMEPWSVIAPILRGLKGKDPEKIRRAIRGYCVSILEKKDEPRAFLILDALDTPLFTDGYSMLVSACYFVLNG